MYVLNAPKQLHSNFISFYKYDFNIIAYIILKIRSCVALKQTRNVALQRTINI